MTHSFYVITELNRARYTSSSLYATKEGFEIDKQRLQVLCSHIHQQGLHPSDDTLAQINQLFVLA
jgi:hypothetical protein